MEWLQLLLFNTKNYFKRYSFTHSKTVLLCITNNFIKHQSFVYIQLNFQCSISNNSIYR